MQCYPIPQPLCLPPRHPAARARARVRVRIERSRVRSVLRAMLRATALAFLAGSASARVLTEARYSAADYVAEVRALAGDAVTRSHTRRVCLRR